MDKHKKMGARIVLFGLLAVVSFLIGGVLPVRIYARSTGTNPGQTSPDTWCVGRRGFEVCVDRSGNILPTTTDNQTSGTSSLEWNGVFTKAITVGSGGSTNAGTSSVTGNLTLGAASSLITTPATVQSVQWSTQTITPSSSFILIGSTGNITLVGTQTISTTTAVNGQFITILSTAATITLQDDTTLAGSGLELGSNTSITVSTAIARNFMFSSGISRWVLIQ
jgi:hypothetical protein